MAVGHPAFARAFEAGIRVEEAAGERGQQVHEVQFRHGAGALAGGFQQREDVAFRVAGCPISGQRLDVVARFDPQMRDEAPHAGRHFHDAPRLGVGLRVGEQHGDVAKSLHAAVRVAHLADDVLQLRAQF